MEKFTNTVKNVFNTIQFLCHVTKIKKLLTSNNAIIIVTLNIYYYIVFNGKLHYKYC